MMQKNNHAENSHDHKGPTSPKLSAGNSPNQWRATTAAKEARIKEAGLGGNRAGEVSASVKRSQAHRDATTDTLPKTGTPAQISPDTERTEEHPIQVQVNTDHNIHGSENLKVIAPDPSDGEFGLPRWRLADAHRMKTPRKAIGHPQPVWFEPF